MAGSMWFGLFIIFFSLITGGLAIAFILTWMRSQRFRLRDPLNKRRYIEDFWMVEKLDKETGIVYWKSVFFQRKLKIPEPPKEAIEVGKRGRKFVEAYRLTEDEWVWITDKGIQVKEVDGQLVAYDVDEKGAKKKIDSFQPFTATQRQVLVNQYTKANEISKKRWGAAEVMGVVSIGGLVMVIALILIFGGDLLKEYRQTRANTQEALETTAEITRNQAMLMQAIGVEVKDFEVTVAQSPTSKKSNVKESKDQPLDIRSTVGLD